MRIKAGDTVRILHPECRGQIRPVVCMLDGLLFFSGIDGGIWPKQVELVEERADGNPCGKLCEHSERSSCRHCRGLCQQPYGECRPRPGEAPVVVFTGPR